METEELEPGLTERRPGRLFGASEACFREPLMEHTIRGEHHHRRRKAFWIIDAADESTRLP